MNSLFLELLAHNGKHLAHHQVYEMTDSSILYHINRVIRLQYIRARIHLQYIKVMID